jgi:site-specific DNA recombinase
MVKPKLPLAEYRRVSRVGDREEDRLRSPQQQRDAIARWAEAEDIAVEQFEAELDESGSKAKRPFLDAIIGRVKAGEVGGLIVHRLNRLSRMSPKDRVLMFEEIENAGGVILSASENIDPSTPEGRFAREVFLAAARMEWEKYRDGFETSKAGSIAAGIPVCKKPALGLRQRPDRRLEHDPVTGPIVRELFERRAACEGPASLRLFLEAHGLAMSRQAIGELLRNRIYLGEISYGGRYVNPKALTPLVDLATWQAAQGPKAGGLSRPRSPDAPYLLSGILRCNACRYAMQGTTSHGMRIYRCTKDHRAGRCPEPAYIRAEWIEPVAVEAFWALTDDLTADPVQDDHGALRGLREALERAEGRLAQLEDPSAQDSLGDRYLTVFAQRREERDDAARQLGAAEASQNRAKPSNIHPVTLRGEWERMTTGDRRELMAMKIDVIALRRDRSFVVYPAGLGPEHPRRGTIDRPTEIRGFPNPPRGVRVGSL